MLYVFKDNRWLLICRLYMVKYHKYDNYQNGALNLDNFDLKPLATIYNNEYNDADDENFMRDLASDLKLPIMVYHLL